MVQWQGNLERDESGEKAAKLDSIEQFEVPNFFVLTKSEIDNFLDTRGPQEIANKNLPEQLQEELKNAYQDIGMSSEVRNASGQARDLVGNQRESQRVSVRISSTDNQAEYELNVGASGLEEAVRNVLSSYYRTHSDTPAVIFQKMIEPEYTGAVIRNYTRRHSLVEMVEGLGHSLEEGITVPEFYLLQNDSVQDARIPGKQVKVSRNPMSGQRRTRTISNSSPTFQNSEVEELARKASREDVSIKFVYKRGTFYVVDAFRSEPMNIEPDLEALKVSEGEIEGRRGEDYVLSDETRETDRPLVAKKGGYTTTHSQQKRKQNIPAVVSLKDTEKIEGSESTSEPSQGDHTFSSSRAQGFSGVTATEVRAVEEFPQLSDNPFSFQDSEDSFADSCEEILSQKAEFVDGRSIDDRALTRCLEVLDDVRVLAVEDPSDEVLNAVVENGLEILAVPRNSVEGVSSRLLRQEKKFIIDNLRS
jgi:hypothetical protein